MESDTFLIICVNLRNLWTDVQALGAFPQMTQIAQNVAGPHTNDEIALNQTSLLLPSSFTSTA
jgi:hypothetical protein